MSGARPAAGAQVLLVEDDVRLAGFLEATLASYGYRVLPASTATAALSLAEQYPPDLVLLDLGLPDADGVSVALRLRQWTHAPILVLSARDQEAEKVRALEAGADDFVTKPFGLAELLARIRACLRRAAGEATAPAEPVFVSGPLRVDLGSRRTSVGGREVHLTPTEFKLLATLIRSAGRVVTHDRLLTAVWGPRSAEQRNHLRVHMTHLRRKLEPDPLRPSLLLTEPGVGYRLAAGEGDEAPRPEA